MEFLSKSPADLTIYRMSELNKNLASKDENSIRLNRSQNTVEMSSLHADANYLLPSGAFLDKSGSANIEPYYNLSISPKLFSSSDLTSLHKDGSRVFDQNTHVHQRIQQGHKRQKLQEMAGPVGLFEPKAYDHLLSLPVGMNQKSNILTQVLRKPMMDMNPDDLLQQQIQQLLLEKDIGQLQDTAPQMNALIQHYMQNQLQQQILNSTPNSRAAHAQKTEWKMRNQLQQQATHPNSSIQCSDDDLYARQLTQYIYNLRNRPKDNSIDYWRKFVSKFYAPGAKERLCLSSYKNLGQRVLSFGNMDTWCCDICGTESGMGFEASFDILPRLCKMKFDGGVLEEILILQFPRKCRFSSGIVMLEYEKAVQESVYEQFRVMHDGILRVTFRHDLKILSWEFCVRGHKEYLPRPLVEPQIKQLICAVLNYQSSLGNTASGRVSAMELLENYNVLLNSAHQLARHMDFRLLNDLGFSRKYVRCLQITEVVNSMKDVMDFSMKRRIGPIDSLQTYPRAGTNRKSMLTAGQEKVEQKSIQNMQIDRFRSMATRFGPKSHINDCGMNTAFSSLKDVRSVLADYYQEIPKENWLNTTGTTSKLEQSYLAGSSSHRTISSSFQGQSFNPKPNHESMLSSFLSSQCSEASKDFQQHLIDKWLQEVVANTFGQQEDQALLEFNTNIINGLPIMARGTGTVNHGQGFEKRTAASLAQANHLANVPGSGGISTNEGYSTVKISNNHHTIEREPDFPEFHVPEVFQSISSKFSNKNDF